MNQVVFKNFANAPLNWINFPHNFPRFRMYHATLILFIVNFILIVFVANYDFFSIFRERLFNPAYDHVVNWTYSYPVNAWIPIKQLLISSPKIILLSLMFFYIVLDYRLCKFFLYICTDELQSPSSPEQF